MLPVQKHKCRVSLNCGLAIVCRTAKREVQGSKPDKGRNFDRDFCSIGQWIPEPVRNLELTYSEEERVERMGADTSVVKKNTKKIH